MHADIFFFVTTILVIVLAMLAAVLVYYAIKIARSVFSITETVRKESENVAEDIASFRQQMKQEGQKAKGMWGIAKKLFLGGAIIRRVVNRVKKKNGRAE